MTNQDPNKIKIKDLSVYYNQQSCLQSISLVVPRNQITGIMGPSNSGKSTLLRILNRLSDLIPNILIRGQVFLEGDDILLPHFDVNLLRARVGMVFAKPIPLPRSIYENLTFGPRLHGVKDRRTLDERVETSLKAAILWDEVKDRLKTNAMELSGGQQQRLCIARALAVGPEVLLMDGPASALDPVATLRIEELMADLRKSYTIVIVTHNMQQASRVSDETAFFTMDDDRAGYLVEAGDTVEIFTNPKNQITEDYVSGRFG